VHADRTGLCHLLSGEIITADSHVPYGGLRVAAFSCLRSVHGEK
jgi:hypothetical protein